MLREARVPIPPATASAATSSLKVVAAVLLVLFRLATDAVLCPFLAAICTCGLGTDIRILGRWICGEGSAVEDASAAIFDSATGFPLTLVPPCILLSMVRILEDANFFTDDDEDKIRKVERAKVYTVPFLALAAMAMWMKQHAEERSLEWKADLLFEIGVLGCSLVASFVAVPNMMLLVMAPRAKGGATKVH